MKKFIYITSPIKVFVVGALWFTLCLAYACSLPKWTDTDPYHRVLTDPATGYTVNICDFATFKTVAENRGVSVFVIMSGDVFDGMPLMHIWTRRGFCDHTHKEIWVATIATFLSKFIFSLTFIVPVLIFRLSTAIIVSVAWGLAMLCVFSYRMAVEQREPPLKVVGEHFIIALAVIALTHYIGIWVSTIFG